MRSGSQRGLYQEQLDLATPQQWHDLVPKDILQQVAAEHGGDQAGGKLSAPVHFWILLVGVLSKGCSSLKDLISRTQERFGRLLGWLNPDDHKPWVTPSALSQRNADRPVRFWQNLYQRLREHHFGSRWLRKLWQKKYASIEAVDSSTFGLMARLRHVFAPSGSGGPKKGSKNKKGALKIHQVFNVGSELPQEVGIGPAREHDKKGFKRALDRISQGVLYLLDRGYCCFDLWRSIELGYAYFITPLKAGLVYEHVKWLNPKRQRDGVRDELVWFPGMEKGGEGVTMRLVSILQEDGSWWCYVTNLVCDDLSAADIAEIYSLRWRIEIFFRHLKHTLNMGHWFAESEAGVQAQLYVALIGYLLGQVILLWASKEAAIAPEQYRLTTIVHELANWLIVQLRTNRLLPLDDLLDSVQRNALDKDRRRNTHYFNPLPA
jgi:DDE family transposase